MILLAPHSNQFIDPLLLMTRTTRRVSFLTARKSMLKKWIGMIARAFHSSIYRMILMYSLRSSCR